MSDITIKPLDLSKTSSGRIDLKPAASPASPSATQGIRLGVNPNRTTSRIDLSAIPGAQAAIRAGSVTPAAPADSEDVYKRRTALLDTSKIPLAATAAPAPAQAAAGGAQPRTIRIARPTIRVGSSSSGATFSPGRPAESEPAAAQESADKPTIRLKRPSGQSISVPASSSSSSSAIAPSDFVIAASEDEVGGIWAVCALLSFLVAAGILVAQILTLKGGAY